jgi:hypothetical protein
LHWASFFEVPTIKKGRQRINAAAILLLKAGGVSPLQPNAFLTLPACIIRRAEIAYCDTPMHFASVQRNAMNFASVVIALRNKSLFGSQDFWHAVCTESKCQTTLPVTKGKTMFFNKTQTRRKTTRQTLTTEQLEPKAMFSVSPVEPVVALDVGPVNQASVEDRMVIEPVFNVGEDSLMGIEPVFNVGENGRNVNHPAVQNCRLNQFQYTLRNFIRP